MGVELPLVLSFEPIGKRRLCNDERDDVAGCCIGVNTEHSRSSGPTKGCYRSDRFASAAVGESISPDGPLRAKCGHSVAEREWLMKTGSGPSHWMLEPALSTQSGPSLDRSTSVALHD